MIIGLVEKEIKQEHKTFWGFTGRQLLSILIFGAPILALNLFIKMPLFARVISGIFAGVGIFFFGFKKYSGMTFEQYQSKKIKCKVYNNDKRFYRTRNAYIAVMNTYYNRIRNNDIHDKAKAKYIKKMQKKADKKKSKLKAYA